MEPQQESFDTFGRWLVTRLRADLANSHGASASPLRHFFANLYEDMLADPGAYFIPSEPFFTFFASGSLTPEESIQHEVLKAARMRVRKIILAYLEFLLSVGQASVLIDLPNGRNIQLPREVFEKLAANTAKKVKSPHFMTALERSGLSFSVGDPVLVSNSAYPDMPSALATFSQACSGVKDFDFYLFRRCDLAVFEGKTKPDFSDALNLVPQPFRDKVAETDQRLGQMHFKREIFLDSGDLTYRLRYSKKGDLVVYWCRILEAFQADLDHYLRWKLDSDLTRRLFNRLDEISPGLDNLVFTGLKACAHCYPNCLDRVQVEWKGKVREVCKGSGWNNIGFSRSDYEKLWTVLGAINELTAGTG